MINNSGYGFDIFGRPCFGPIARFPQ